MRAGIAAALLLATSAVMAAARAADSLPAYHRLIVSSRRATEDGLTQAEANALRARFATTTGVTLPGGQRFVLDNADLARQIAAAANKPARSPAVAALRARLHALSDALAASPPSAASDVRAQAAAILARAQFAPPAPPRPPTAWERFRDRVLRAIGKFFRDLFGGLPRFRPGQVTGVGQVLKFVLVFAATVAAVVGLFLLAVRLRERRAARRRGTTGAGGALDLADDTPDPLAAARQQAAQGDYRMAVRLAYIASLRRLHGAGLLTLDPHKTNHEYQRALRARSRAAYDTLLPVTRLFDQVWYGSRPATPAEYEQALRAHDALPAPNASATAVAQSAAPAKDDNPW